eukprot:TRINITY_DN9792_c0_g1_i1.p1 TRINITY_DN9792_c0_g1~~TRINITY_DN9792_c0_g1_i1.p1  ORF type:complete len:352 (+),score=82.50 TRINITY_DN9792_c0_g1_i1:30-1085(+)
MRTNQKWLYVKRPVGEVESDTYKLVEEPVLNELKEGQVLVRSLYISVDPYMRIQQAESNTWEKPHPFNEVQDADVAGIVEESKSTLFKKGDYVATGVVGWQRYGIVDEKKLRLVDVNAAPLSSYIGILGMPGRTSYFGFLEEAKPKKGEVVVVSGAAGAVGSIVVQLAKLSECKVIGLAGSEDKMEYLRKLGVDETINYKQTPDIPSVQKALKEAIGRIYPDRSEDDRKIDIYFDNVGGYITDAIFPLINLFARIIICGQISQYLGKLDKPELCPRFLHHILYQRATIKGILARDYNHRMGEMVDIMTKYLKEGKIKLPNETIVEGFNNLPNALNSLFHGSNTGKLIVKCE